MGMTIRDCDKCGKSYMYSNNEFQYRNFCQECVEKDKIKIIDYYFPLNCEENMDITVELNGYRFRGLIKQEEKNGEER